MSKDTEAATVDVLRSAGGVVERDELRYQLDRRGMRADPDLSELIDKGLVEKVNGGFQAVVAPRPGKPRSRHNQLDDEELLDVFGCGRPSSASHPPRRRGRRRVSTRW